MDLLFCCDIFKFYRMNIADLNKLDEFYGKIQSEKELDKVVEV